MIQSELISVIIPCYNQANFLEDAIRSVQKQTHQNYEIIVVNDGSTDNTSQVAAAFPAVRLIEQENKGLAAARNVGLSESKGEYLVFLDADDRLLPDALETGLNALRDHPQSVFATGFCKFISSDGEPRRFLFHPTIADETDKYIALLRRNFIWSPSTVMYRRSVFTQVGGFNSDLSPAADYELYLRIARKFPIYQYEKFVAEYRKHESSMSNNPELMLENVLEVFKLQKGLIKADKHYQKALNRGVTYFSCVYGSAVIYQIFYYSVKFKFVKALRRFPMLFNCSKLLFNFLAKA